MCSIIGGFLRTDSSQEAMEYLDRLQVTMIASIERGRDSFGVAIHDNLTLETERLRFPKGPTNSAIVLALETIRKNKSCTFVGNFRGEPTTEWVEQKRVEDVQPFSSPNDEWFFSHNGTIANDKEILDELYKHAPTAIDSYAIGVALEAHGFKDTVQKHLKGSFAIVAYHKRTGVLYYATNYKPLYAIALDGGVIVASQERYLFHPNDANDLYAPRIQKLGPYTMGYIQGNGSFTVEKLNPMPDKRRTLVVCSGGLDSGVVAWKHFREGDDIALLHLRYGAKAEGPEVRAVERLGAAMDCPVLFVNTDFFSKFAGSTLTDPTLAINTSRGGEAGAEFAHEWVPARNTVMLALATAYAEKHNYNIVALGSNMEEGGAYPDNEMEFINRWRDLAPFAVKAYHPLTYSDPCGPLVKHEIVELGAALGMPFEMTWSCYEGQWTDPELLDEDTFHYKSEIVHCGICGPCAMRRKAFRMAGVEDPTIYAH